MRPHTITLALLGLAASLSATASFAKDPPPIADFVRHAQYGTVKISPDGKYLAITVDRAEQDVLAVLQTSDLKLVKVNQLPEERSVGQYYWASNKRLVFNASRKLGSFAAPFSTGEWFAVDADGSRPEPIVFRGTRSASERGKTVTNERFSLLDRLPEDDRNVLMQVVSPRSREGVNTEVARVDIYTGRRKTIATAPRDNCSFALDAKREPRFAVCRDNKNAEGEFEEHTELYVLEESGEWRKISSSHTDQRSFEVLGSGADGRIYALADDQKGPRAFGLLDTASGGFRTLFQDEVADPSRFIVSSDGDTVIAVVSEAGLPEVHLVDEEHPDTAIYLSMVKAFPGQFVDLASATSDGRLIVFSVFSDRNPGELYLYDRDTGQARFLMRNRAWIDPEAMASMTPISYKSRDGLTIHGYLTLPKDGPRKNLPMIINPHGGPIGPRDNWGFNPEVQLLASRGYAVLQVNYRGSGGFGKEFMEMGHREWGGKMQDDLTDATNWAIEQGYADKDRICIYGGSYGGYASLMGVAKEPDLYACAVGYVGLYDVDIQLKKSDTSQSRMGQRYFDRTFGTSKEEHARVSPVNYASNIKAPVLLAAGARDPRCPPEHTRAMADALEKAGNAPEDVIIESGEMHGFYKPESRERLYTAMLAFFDRHTGSKVTVGSPEKQD